jgi:hypothetical protein
LGQKLHEKTVIQQPQQSTLNMVRVNSTLDLDGNVTTLPFDDGEVDTLCLSTNIDRTTVPTVDYKNPF